MPETVTRPDPTPVWAWRDGDVITCHEITHDGEGEPGRSVELVTVTNSGGACAEHAAVYFGDLDKQAHDLTDSDLDGGSSVIEVRGVYDRPTRYRVYCQVKREYHAETEGT
jgi:hypothetical protein